MLGLVAYRRLAGEDGRVVLIVVLAAAAVAMAAWERSGWAYAVAGVFLVLLVLTAVLRWDGRRYHP